MNKSNPKQLLLLIKYDVENLNNNLNGRKQDYLTIFSMKRTRSHFSEIFFSRYDSLSISELSCFSEDLITALNDYYVLISELKWYLYHTEDLPQTVNDYVELALKKLERPYNILKLYFEAEQKTIQEARPN